MHDLFQGWVPSFKENKNCSSHHTILPLLWWQYVFFPRKRYLAYQILYNISKVVDLKIQSYEALNRVNNVNVNGLQAWRCFWCQHYHSVKGSTASKNCDSIAVLFFTQINCCISGAGKVKSCYLQLTSLKI